MFLAARSPLILNREGIDVDRWTPGDTVVIRNIARSDNSVTAAVPTIAIRDDDESLALYIPTGTTAKDNYAVASADRAAAIDRALPSLRRDHADRVWTAPSIRLYLPGQAFSVWLFFTASGQFASWYGNLESPYLRTPLGIDTRDHALDVIADPAGQWRWKDEAEFAQRLKSGRDSPVHQAAVRAAGQAFIARLQKREAPFDQYWPLWRASDDWRPRDLPPNWKDDLGTGARLR